MPATSNLIADIYSQAQKHHQARHFAEAERLYRRVTGADDSHIGAWHHLGLVCLAQNKLAEAAEAFQHVLARSPQHADALTELGIVLARQDQLLDAISRFRQKGKGVRLSFVN